MTTSKIQRMMAICRRGRSQWILILISLPLVRDSTYPIFRASPRDLDDRRLHRDRAAPRNLRRLTYPRSPSLAPQPSELLALLPLANPVVLSRRVGQRRHRGQASPRCHQSLTYLRSPTLILTLSSLLELLLPRNLILVPSLGERPRHHGQASLRRH